MTGGDITVTLDRSVALVLFEFLSRTTDEEDGEPLADALQFKSELPALWATLAALEDVLTVCGGLRRAGEGRTGGCGQEIRRRGEIRSISASSGADGRRCLQRGRLESNITRRVGTRVPHTPGDLP